MTKPTYRRHLSIVLAPLLCALVFSCTAREKYAGQYLAQVEEASAYAETRIELKEDGQGYWCTPEDEVSFSWYVKGNEIRLNIKQGGVIVGTPVRDGAFEVQFPGTKKLLFERSG